MKLSAPASRLYEEMKKGCVAILTSSENKLVYSPPLDNTHDAVAELIQLGLVSRERIGRRRVFVLGTWKAQHDWFKPSRLAIKASQTSELDIYLARYTQAQRVILQKAFADFARTRARNKIAQGVLLTQLRWYDQYPADVVIVGLTTYVNGGYAYSGKGENYARGIIRQEANQHKHEEVEVSSGERQIKEERWKKIQSKVGEAQTIEIERAHYVQGLCEERRAGKKLTLKELASLTTSVLEEVVEREKKEGTAFWKEHNDK